MTIQLGDLAEDTVTGYRGTAVAKHFFLHGITTISLQPEMEHYGRLPDTDVFAEAQLTVIKLGTKRKPIIVK